MSKKILIDAVYPGETRVVIYDQNRIQDFDYENSHKKQLKGNIYLARVTRVEPSLQAAFIEYGGDKHGFLPFNEIHPSYFLQNPKDQFEQETNGAVLATKILAINLPEVIDIEEVITTEEPLVEVTTELEGNSSINDAEKELSSENIDEEEILPEEEGNRNSFHQNYKIQDVIRKGQVILVQIIKEERGNKGAACTSYISLAGRYCVLMPNSDRQGGISRRIINSSDRKRLKEVLTALDLSEGVSVILRTAGAGKNINDIRRDYFYLARLWNAVREYTLSSNVNTFIHAESDLLKRTIRDLYSSEISEIFIQGTEAFKATKEFIKKLLPLHVNKVKEYKSKVPIFTKFNIEEQIAALYNPVAHLPSGGYIVINPTEALIAVDVNSGKATNERNIEETATKTNIEAAIEIARQLRLRDMSGLIVIDFIDMMDINNRRSVEKALRDAFQVDRAKVQLSNISPFGLLELSRQRLQSSFMEANSVACPSCNGKGYIKSFESNALVMLRTIESEIHKCDSSEINIYAHPEIILHLLNNKREQLSRLEQLYKCKVILHKENTVYYDGFAVEKVAKNEKQAKSDAPKLKNEDHIEAYDKDILEDITTQEDQLGLGEDLAPLKVNDNIVMNEAVETYVRSNRTNKFHKSGTRRKINNNNNNRVPSGNNEQSAFQNKPALIYQPEESATRPKREGGRNRNGKFNDRRKKFDGNKNTEKKSVLKSWWEKFIE